MRQWSDVSFLWRDETRRGRFRAGVCLHGHTMHSEECLSFLPRYLHRIPGVSGIVRHYRDRPHQPVDFSRAYWTPPLTPSAALRLEREQIVRLGLDALVSLTDHDSIEAGAMLQLAADRRHVPVSLEWTVPYARSIFHLGIHNLPLSSARSWMSAMAAYTAAPKEALLPELLREIARIEDVLVVLNHPFWLEEGVRETDHGPALDRLLRACVAWLHALELNGTRPWSENAAAVELARAHSRPVISGGDRHACEPSAVLNLTNAQTFSEFAREVRGGHSSVLVLPHYRQPMAFRILEAICDILREYPEFPGRKRWIDRFFYRGEDGAARSVAALCADREPWVVKPLTGPLQLLAAGSIRGTLRFLLSRRMEVLP